MSEALQDIVELDAEIPSGKRRKEAMLANKRPAIAAVGSEPTEQELSQLVCDRLGLNKKQRLLSGFIGLTFFVPYLSLSLTHPEWAGHIGRRLSLGLFSFLGQATLLIPFILAYLFLSAAGLRVLRQTRYAATPFILITLSALVERSSQSGGWIGALIDRGLLTAVGPGGAWLFTGVALLLALFGFFPGSWHKLLNATLQKVVEIHEAIKAWLINLEHTRQSKKLAQAAREKLGDPPNSEAVKPVKASQPDNKAQHPFLSVESLEAIDSAESQQLDTYPTAELLPPAQEQIAKSTKNTAIASILEEKPVDEHYELGASDEIPATLPIEPKPEVEDLDDPSLAVPKARAFELPPLVLLDDTPFSERRPKIEDKSKALLDALDSFGVKAKLSQIVRGPSVTRYELLPARGVKVSKFTSLTNDIALALASTAVRIEAPIPGKSAIGIEIPNEITDLVVLKDIIRDTIFTSSKGLTVALGKDLTGRPVVTDLQKMPHLLVAGTTGSGKSVCVNGLIVSLLYRFTPNELQLMMVDPKQVELSIYEEIPHLVGFTEGGAGEIIVDPKKAAQALHQVVELMEQRYTQFATIKVRNLAEYNQKAETPLPWFVVIIDELADLMMVASKSVETSICRIAQKARAAGIHLVLATQRPSADVITGLIKVNIPSRIAFAVSSQVDSRVILDSGGAENLLGKGDMLFLPVDASDPRRIQGAYVTNEEISRIVEFWKGQQLPENRIEFELKDDPLLEESESADDNSDDGLLEEALRFVLQRDQASASMLQTDLKVGYARARRLLMAMEKKGWVGPAEGSKPRKILFSGSLSASED